MADRIAALKELAQRADEGYSGAHPRDSNNWQANEAFCRACDPSTILKLVAVVEKARQAQSSLTVAVESDLGEAWLNPQTARDQWLRDAREALAALRSALAALDDREPA